MTFQNFVYVYTNLAAKNKKAKIHRGIKQYLLQKLRSTKRSLTNLKSI